MVLLAYYVAPLLACNVIAFFVPGWWKWAVLGLGFAWPVGNILVGVLMRCD